MKKINKKSTRNSILGLLLLTAGTAQAAMVNFTLTGEITNLDLTNPYGLSIGDMVTAEGVYDDSILSIAPEGTFIDFSTGYNNMTISIGSITYTDDMDVLGGASLYFVGDMFDGLDYSATDGSFDSWGTLGTIDDFTGTGIMGTWMADSFNATAVPLPGAAWLFGSGLAFLAGIARSRSSKAGHTV